MKQLPADAKILARELKPVLDALEKGRQKSLWRIQSGWKKIGITVLITVGAVILALGVSTAASTPSPAPTPPGYGYSRQSHNSGNSPVILIIVAGVGIATCGIIYFQFIRGHDAVYKAVYKSKVIAGLTKLIQPDMVYSPDRGISKATFKSIGLYSANPDRYHSEDLFAGKMGKTSLMFSEAHAEDKQTSTNSKGHTTTHWVTIFKGLIIIADFNKHFRSWVTIKPDVAERSFGWLGRKLQGLSSNLIRLENPDFERAFVVHGGDQVEARYLLTPDMQERLLDLRQWFGDDIRVALHRSKLHLTIPNRDNWFEPNINRPAHDISQIHNFIHQMTSIFRIVEMLDLNTRIWTKQ